MILYNDPHRHNQYYQQEIKKAVNDVLNSSHYILAHHVNCFETEFAQYLQVKHSIGVASGTDALHLSLLALDIGCRDEVIVPSHTAVATVAAIKLVGATPVFVDIDKTFCTLNPKQIHHAITKQTKAIIVVHLYGSPADMQALLNIAQQYQLELIEDCAQATGARYQGQAIGSLGTLGCFSFYPTKTLGGIGDGGAISCNNTELTNRIRSLRQYGWDSQHISHEIGLNSRLDELQAAILRVKLRHLDSDNQIRIQLAQNYTQAFTDLPIEVIQVQEGANPVYHLYVIIVQQRAALIEHLKKANIIAGIHYPIPVHKMPAYTTSLCHHSLSITEKMATQVLSLPLYVGLSHTEQTKVINSVRDFFSSFKPLK